MIETFVVRKPEIREIKEIPWGSRYEYYETTITLDHEDGIISKVEVKKEPLSPMGSLPFELRMIKTKVVKTRIFNFAHPDMTEKLVLGLDEEGYIVTSRVVIGRVRKPKPSKLPKPQEQRA